MNVPTFFRLARNVSRLSDNRFRMGCVIVKNGSPVAVGYNRNKTHPKAPRKSLHAEMVAVHCCGNTRLKGSSIFVYRENKNNMPAMAKPCKHCMEILKKLKFKWIFYSVSCYPYWNKERLFQ